MEKTEKKNLVIDFRGEFCVYKIFDGWAVIEESEIF
jgi:hypothetical protein